MVRLKNMIRSGKMLTHLDAHNCKIRPIILCGLLGLLLNPMVACKPDDSDGVPPTIELDSGGLRFDIQVPDTLKVRVRIRSQQTLDRALLRVQRSDGVALLPPQVRTLWGRDTLIEWEVMLTDSLLPSGQFQLVFQAVSGDQTGSLFLPLRLWAVPRRFMGVVWFIQEALQSSVYRSDSLGGLIPRESSVSLDLIQCASWPGSGRVWLRGQTSPVLWGYQLDFFSFNSIYSTPSDPGQSPYTYMSGFDNGVYVSRGLGDVLRFSQLGAPGGQFSIPPDFVPVFTSRQQEHLLVELRARPPSSLRRVRIYHADFQGLLREFMVSGNVLGAARVASDAWILLVEQQNTGLGRVWRYNLSTQQLLEESPGTVDHQFRTMVPGVDGYWLGGTTGVWYFRPSSGVQTGLWQRRFSDMVTDLFFDPRMNRLIGWRGTNGLIWNPDSGGRIECQLPDSIRFACPY